MQLQLLTSVFHLLIIGQSTVGIPGLFGPDLQWTTKMKWQVPPHLRDHVTTQFPTTSTGPNEPAHLCMPQLHFCVRQLRLQLQLPGHHRQLMINCHCSPPFIAIAWQGQVTNCWRNWDPQVHLQAPRSPGHNQLNAALPLQCTARLPS